MRLYQLAIEHLPAGRRGTAVARLDSDAYGAVVFERLIFPDHNPAAALALLEGAAAHGLHIA